ncbi:MAG: VCBS repeat-containing protein, partial [Deltaproteobacteria bacterium]
REEIEILYGRGDGTFEDPQSLPAREGVASLSVGDFNLDGHQDVAVLEDGDNARSTLNGKILWGAGGRAFLTQGQYPTGENPIDLATADFDGDGVSDLVTADADARSFSLLLGNGDGTFADPQAHTLPAKPTAIVAGDLDGDGNADVAVAHDGTFNNTKLFLGRGNGTFEEPTGITTGQNTVFLTLLDLDGDGHLDLLAANRSANTADCGNQVFIGDLAILYGRGGGAFLPPRFLTAGENPAAVTAADLDGDGRRDLVVVGKGCNDEGGGAAVLLATGDRDFADAVFFETGQAPAAVIAHDLDLDGTIDLATANTFSHDVTFLSGRGDGTFRPPIRFAVGLEPRDLALVDADLDGRPDLVTANFDSSDLSVLLNDGGEGVFLSERRFAAGRGSGALSTADFDGNGRPDLATADARLDRVSILLHP